MLRNKIYYRLKPFIPLPVRMALRQKFAGRLRARTRDIWPIMPGSEHPPKYWPGWPNGKKFAFVLTHDVEGSAGLNRCQQLMQLEMELGFRSSFNFIPEGNYRVPAKLREELVGNGFEVGVHDFRHDGHLFASRREFLRLSSHINHYINEWDATGFRSGFMLHNLDWLHNLDIKYDASTFDIDPFEPQPEGRHTIFPFWIPAPGTGHARANGKEGYVELPYTLPQDSTLFLLLRDENIDTWRKKLDWIAQHGGMALVNVHPDYLHFDDKTSPSRTYPATNYRELLTYVRECYGNQFWQALPKEVAAFVTNLRTRPVFQKPKRVCMVTHSFYESDNRVTRYAEALAARGDHVDVLSLRRTPDLPKEETIQGVNVFRIRDRFSKTERSTLAYLMPLLRFLATSGWWITRRHARTRYDLLHIHNVPDFLVFSGWYPKLTGAKIILDIHDIVPEFFASKFADRAKGVVLTLLGWMERASASFADHIIIANHLWLDKYAARTGATGRCSAFINNVDCNIFTPQPTRQPDGKQIVLFPGGLQWHQGIDLALRAFRKVRTELPNVEFHIYGDGSEKESLIQLAEELNLNGSVRFFKPTSVREIATVMAQADLGVVPKRADSFGNEAYSTKIMEFMAVGVPVVVSNTKVDRYYFNDSIVRFFESGDPDALAQKMLELLRNPELRHELTKRAAEYAARNSWQNRKADYLEIVDSICSDGRSARPARDAESLHRNADRPS